MKLHYQMPNGESNSWYVKELEPGKVYQMVDAHGNLDPLFVQTNSGRSVRFDGFDGFIIDGREVFAVSLLSHEHRVKVGSDPSTSSN